MTKKQLKQLVMQSYINNTLNQKRVEAIADNLKRRELKDYIRTLKKWESKRNVIVSLPYLPKEKEKKILEGLFPQKKIIYNIDSSLILGMEVTDNDLVLEMNLKNTLNNLLSYLEEQND